MMVTKQKPMAPAKVPMSTPTAPGLNGQGAGAPPSRGNSAMRYSPPAENFLPPEAFHKR